MYASIPLSWALRVAIGYGQRMVGMGVPCVSSSYDALISRSCTFLDTEIGWPMGYHEHSLR